MEKTIKEKKSFFYGILIDTKSIFNNFPFLSEDLGSKYASGFDDDIFL